MQDSRQFGDRSAILLDALHTPTCRLTPSASEHPERPILAITYRIDPRERIVYLTVTGESPFEEWEDVLRRVLADPAYVKRFNFLTDRRGQSVMPGPDFTLKVLRLLVAHTSEMGRYRWAAVTPWPAPFGTLRMFSILAEEADIHIEAFTDYDEAQRWLSGGMVAES